jgi:ParB-like chromosome segregation protein Spo0J
MLAEPDPDEGGAGGIGWSGSPVPFFVAVRQGGEQAMDRWNEGSVRPVAVAALGEGYRRYRLADPTAEEAMARSLRRYGQQAPLAVCARGTTLEVIDGFKRQTAARLLGWPSLSVRVVEADERTVKAAIYGLNRVGRHLGELEEAWIVQALVREDGLTQVEAAALLGRHKSWVCRRLALLEKLGPPLRDELRLGLLAPTLARQLLRLPTDNQAETLAVVRREGLTAVETEGVVTLLLGAGSRPQAEYVLAQPRTALAQRQGGLRPAWDPRLSAAGNRLARQLAEVLGQLQRLEHWLLHRNQQALPAAERRILLPEFTRLVRDSSVVAELTSDFLAQESPHE